MKYRAQDQDQPTSYDCVPTSASMGIDGTTAGVKRPSPVALRSSTGVAYPAGISYIAMTGATVKVSNVPSEARFGISDSAFIALAQSGRNYCVSVWAGTYVNTIRHTGSFTGGHTLFAPERNYSVWPGGDRCACDRQTTVRHSELRIQDPGTYSAGYVQFSLQTILAAAHERTRRAGASGINVLVFPDTTDVYRRMVHNGYIRQEPSSQSPKVKALEARTYHVLEIVAGDAYFLPDGHRSNAWYRVPSGFIRGDKLGTTNVSAP